MTDFDNLNAGFSPDEPPPTVAETEGQIEESNHRLARRVLIVILVWAAIVAAMYLSWHRVDTRQGPVWFEEQR